ncbi:hypothetical protein WJX72_003279 [[Myrmecia] bisecta]|uniref:Uncharacterized protein n=1 Tax=[Myrmecia] bisecta TaxID=41462 RepID=A0AAW1PRI9_9CHLO
MEWVDRRVEEIGEEWHDKINVESGRIMAVFPFPKVREGPAAGLMIRPPEIWYPPDPRMYGGGRPPSSGGGSSSGGGRGGAGGGGGSSGELSGESSGESSGVPSREGLVALSLALLVCGAAWWLIRTMLRAYENALVLAASPHPAPVFPSSLSGYGTRLAAGTLGKAAAGSTPPAGGSGNDRRHNAAK